MGAHLKEILNSLHSLLSSPTPTLLSISQHLQDGNHVLRELSKADVPYAEALAAPSTAGDTAEYKVLVCKY